MIPYYYVNVCGSASVPEIDLFAFVLLIERTAVALVLFQWLTTHQGMNDSAGIPFLPLVS